MLPLDHKDHEEEYSNRKCIPHFLVHDFLCMHHKLVDFCKLLNMNILNQDNHLFEQMIHKDGALKILEELEFPYHS
jgi:hypothetical protein